MKCSKINSSKRNKMPIISVRNHENNIDEIETKTEKSKGVKIAQNEK